MMTPFFKDWFTVPKGDVIAHVAFCLMNPPIHMQAQAIAEST